MVEIGGRRILWHIMKYYAHFGLRAFVLYLGIRRDATGAPVRGPERQRAPTMRGRPTLKPRPVG
jgi:hypothetical protein